MPGADCAGITRHVSFIAVISSIFPKLIHKKKILIKKISHDIILKNFCSIRKREAYILSINSSNKASHYMRKLYSTNIPCQAGCQYCFAKWDKTYHKLPQLENIIFNEKKAILYPCCDGEFFDQNGLSEQIRKMAEHMDKLYVSISTKRPVNDDEISRLVKLNQELLSADKGFVKFGISLSNYSMLDKLEPGTMSYAERLELARRLKDTPVFLALTLKPLLPFITPGEYCQIIHDFSQYTNYVLIGGLYLEPGSKFRSKYISPEHPTWSRTVEWLPERPEWEYIEDPEQFRKIRTYASAHEVLLFDSDVDLINCLINRRR